MKSFESLKIAIVNGGGGARGDFQARINQILFYEYGVKANILSGISTGSLTACMLAMGKVDRLVEMHKNIREEDVSIMRSHVGIAQRMGLYKLGIGRFLGKLGIGEAPLGMHDNSPLMKLIQQELDYDIIDR